MFKTWLEEDEKGFIFVDLDETLVLTRYLINANNTLFSREQRLSGEYPRDPKTLAKLHSENGGTVIKINQSEDDWANNWFVTYRRPGAIEFIESIKPLTQVFILTSGGKPFQTNVIKIHKIPIAENQILGRQEYGQVPQNPKSVLVDDLTPQTSGAKNKLQAIGSQNLIHVMPWLDVDMSDNVLLSQTLPQIKKYFSPL